MLVTHAIQGVLKVENNYDDIINNFNYDVIINNGSSLALQAEAHH